MYTFGGKAMLTKFSVENYKSFKNKITLDLTKSHDYDFNKDAINDKGIIKNAIIFGKNGSGKSNLAFALFDIVSVLTANNVNIRQLDKRSFLNFNSSKKFATFTYEFIYNNVVIVYEYRKKDPKTIIYEKLTVANQEIFCCDLSKKSFISLNVDKIDFDSFNYDNYHFDISFIKYMLAYGSHKQDSIIKFICDFASRMLYFRSLQENAYIGISNGAEQIIAWIIENNKVKELEEFLNTYAKLNVKLDVAISSGILPQKTLVMVNDKGDKALDFALVNSSGTIAMTILFYWYQQLNNVSLLFIDEFDAFYHFELSKKVVEMFKQMKNIQVLLTSHNTYIASNNVLRPDCYFIIDNKKIDSFIDRTARELREAHNLEKLLRSGEFDG